MPSDDETVWNVLHNWAFAVIKEFPFPETYIQLCGDMAKLSAMERGVAGLRWTESEVFNGGFEQLYVNSRGFWAREAVAGFTMLGRSDFAEIVNQSLLVFPNIETACMQDAAEAFLEQDEAAFDRLDELSDAFYALEELQSMRDDILKFSHLHVVDGKVI